ncbi:tRNA-dihydrouridine(47) synthase [Hortaea werneckii]|nr:tRNA-dihydrouridine(47) synthase [Hortaea werneckii]KAI6848688.1 tRNA-dihydrouridine(47) synthase [Hortaea werneckii]KAI6908158.1 tRNA-dihydrouridine(47) synthase [Hortaea werneckii]KAI6933209.1 tRNA-dihydrouridine(47) synthase [Hortaea werneckii]KAI6964201.1 tRNA-dihydrouridine(47) synthase [Hortaea werneckii]
MAQENGDQNGIAVPPPDTNPLNDQELLKPSTADPTTKEANPQASILPGDSELTKAEKIERHGNDDDDSGNGNDDSEPSAKRRKLSTSNAAAPPPEKATEPTEEQPGRKKGVAPIKKEFLIDVSRTAQPSAPGYDDDDAAEASGKNNEQEPVAGRGGGQQKEGKKRGQNKGRNFGSSRDEIELCKSRAHANEFAEQTCRFGPSCKFEHDIRRYLKDGKREDLGTFNGLCPIWEVKGRCSAGWRCRFAGSHSKEMEREDGRKELVLVDKESVEGGDKKDEEDEGVGVVNVISNQQKIELRKKLLKTPMSEKYLEWMNKQNEGGEKRPGPKKPAAGEEGAEGGDVKNGDSEAKHDHRAGYVDPPLRASEKRRLYYGPETPVLAPLTTQGNLPFRRLCVSLGAQVTWSEMAMGLPLLQGEKGEWALMKAHESEATPPAYNPKPGNMVVDYDNSKDLKFGAQIAANKPWLAMKTTEVLTALCPHLRAIDLNCGCPIDLVCRQGAGSAMLDTHSKLEKTLRGMNLVSGPTPITVKIRMGTKDKQPTAEKLCQRLILGGPEAQEGPSGVACITLHGRSKQQRYTRSADWDYIASCSTLIKNLRTQTAAVTDTVREPDARDQAPVPASNAGLPFFCGNGDVLSPEDYTTHLANSGVDTCMIGRGALIKPWLFEEIAQNQYLDKSSSERLRYIETFVRNGLEYWGSDEIGVGTTRRFLLEWLSFACRYVPVGLLEYLPPRFGDRPPAFRGRDHLETLLSSGNYKDWIRISEMFLGPAHKDFNFQPKHKSNSYEIEAEG